MAVFTMNDLIKCVEKKTVPKTNTEVLLAFNERNQTVSTKKPRLSWGTRYYLIRNNNDNKHVARSPGVRVQVGRPGYLVLDVQISYEASCLEGNEEQLLRAFFHPNDKPRDLLERHLRHWTREYGSQHFNLESVSLSQFKRGLTSFLINKAEELGLTLLPSIAIQADVPESMHLKDLSFTVKLHDAPDPLPVIFDADVLVDRDRLHIFLAGRITQKQVGELILAVGQRYFIQEVGLSDYYFARNERLKSTLSYYLEPELKERGLHLASLSIRGDEPPIPANFEHIMEAGKEIQVGTKRNFQVHPQAKMRIILRDIRQFCTGSLEVDAVQGLVEKEAETLFELLLSRASDRELLNPERIKMEVANSLNARLVEYGLGAELLNLNIDFPRISINHEFNSGSIPIPIKLPKREAAVTINFRVHMILQSRADYILAGHPDLRAWVTRELERITGKLLFKYDYLRLVLDFEDDAKPEIDALIREKAKEIGYELDLLVVTPDLQPLKWRDSFLLELDNITFPTKVPSHSVKLGIYLRLSLKNLRFPRLEALIRDEADLDGKIGEAIRDKLLPYFHELDPQRFYVGFEIELPPHLQVQPGEKPLPPVKRELERLIREVLEEQFDATVETISIKQLDTELSDRLNALLKQRAEFEFTLESFKGFQAIPFAGTLRVTGVDVNGWHIFVSSEEFDIDEIVRRVCRFLAHRAGILSEKALAFVEANNYGRLTEIFEILINEATCSQFGLRVALVDFGRGKTVLEKDRALRLAEGERLELETYSHALGERRKNLSTAANLSETLRSNDQEQMENLTEEIAALRRDNMSEEAEELVEQLEEIKRRYLTAGVDEGHRKLLEKQPRRKEEEVIEELESFMANSPKTSGLPMSPHSMIHGEGEVPKLKPKPEGGESADHVS